MIRFLAFAMTAAAFVPLQHPAPRPRRALRLSATAPPLDVAADSQLAQLAKITTLSIDTGDLDVLARYAATGLITDATTNPLFVSQAGKSGDPRYRAFVEEALAYAKRKECDRTGCSEPDAVIELAMDRLAVNLGAEIVKIVPGYVSTEVDIRASFDTEESLRRARRIIAMYEELGVPRSRVLIKLAATWEGIKAAEELEREGITCNLTLVFGFAQAVACAQAGVRLISPFPGRVLDWHTANGGQNTYEPLDDPGVLTVMRIHNYFKEHGHSTICMPASWRPSRGKADPAFATDEVVALAGIDRMTLPPALLESLAATREPLDRVVPPGSTAPSGFVDAAVRGADGGRMDRETYTSMIQQDFACLSKFCDGIAAFYRCTEELEATFKEEFGSS